MSNKTNTTENLSNPNTFINHLNDLKREVKQESNMNTIPIDIFPEKIQRIIKEYKDCLNYPTDFTIASMLYAVSVAIGNTHMVEINPKYIQSAAIYIALVGRPGTGKSHPLKSIVSPITSKNNEKYHEYLKKKEESKEVDKQERIEPFLEQYLVKDFTIEALTSVLSINKRGLGVYVDELATWFKNFNRYNKGSEEQFWLGIWDGEPITVNRKNSDPINIPTPFVSVAGTIQPNVVKEMIKDKIHNGFIDRILFVMPDDLKKEYWSEKEIDPKYIKQWEEIVYRLLELPIKQNEYGVLQSKIIQFEESNAKEILYEWQREMTDEINDSDDIMAEVFAKVEPYVVRFSLILQMMYWACGEDDKKSIKENAVRGAMALADYFINSAIKVRNMISNVNPFDALPQNKQDLYHDLPDTFTTAEGVRVLLTKEYGIGERTFKSFIKNKKLFNYTKRGNYEKLI